MLTIRNENAFYGEKTIAYCGLNDLKIIKQQKGYLEIVFMGTNLYIDEVKKLTFDEMEDLRCFLMAEIESNAVWDEKELKQAIIKHIERTDS